MLVVHIFGAEGRLVAAEFRRWAHRHDVSKRRCCPFEKQLPYALWKKSGYKASARLSLPKLLAVCAAIVTLDLCCIEVVHVHGFRHPIFFEHSDLFGFEE